VRPKDDFRDLAPLDPSRDAARWERMVAGIGRAAAPELERRARLPQPGLLHLLAAYARPALSAAALVAAIGLGVLAAAGGPADADAAPSQAQVADALGYPTPLAAWVDPERTPGSAEMLTAIHAGER
jgi:hypothetical protein